VGVTERAALFKRMRDLTRQIATVYLEQRERAGMPWVGRRGLTTAQAEQGMLLHLPMGAPAALDQAAALDNAAASRPLVGCVPFLFEIGTEELPASHLTDALAQLSQWVPQELDDLRLEHGEVRVWGTPRRLTIFVEQLAVRQPDEERLVKGPPARAALDKEGVPTRAAQGFARSRGVDVADLEVQEIDGGQYVVAQQSIEGRSALEVLALALPQWVAKLHFPRSMRWNETGVAFSRPIRWLTALQGEQVVKFSYAGLLSNRVTIGPRPAGSPRVALASAGDYQPTLASYGVIVDPLARQADVLCRAETAAAEVGGQIPDDPGLLEEVANLVEVPTAILGGFEDQYLDLPQEVLIAVMKKHQRYFPVMDADGKIMANFVTIRNGGREHMDLVRQGYEDVIRARYADAEFFYARDRRQPLEAYRDGLAKLTFQAEIGSMLDKSERLETLAPWLGGQLGLSSDELTALKRAAHLAKADLATSMVVEMTSLQGIMGREYASLSGESPVVAAAIFEHYLPRSAGDRVPTSTVGTVLALADRADSLAGLFSVGMVPTGSADPYGLRRTAAGIVQILLEKQIKLSLRDVMAKALAQLPVPSRDDTLDTVLSFVAGRLEVALRDTGLAHDVVAAVLAERGDNPTLALQAAEQLTAWINRDDWGYLLDNYARCVRITRSEPRLELVPGNLVEDAEKALYQALGTAESRDLCEGGVDQLMAAFVPMVPTIQSFFDKVLVMAQDEVLREARLALLQRVAALATGIVDLGRLEGF